MEDREKRFHKLANSIIAGDQALTKELLKTEMYHVDFEEFYTSTMLLLDSNLVINNKNKAIKYKEITKARSEIWFKSIPNENVLTSRLEFVKYQRDSIYNALQKTRILISPDSIEFQEKQETLKILALLPIMIDEIFENYLALIYSHTELATGVVFADSVSASSRGKKPKKEKPEKQAVVNFAIKYWENSPNFTLDDIAEQARNKGITAKSFGTIKNWIAEYNPNRKNK